jgi:hypothetical protein
MFLMMTTTEVSRAQIFLQTLVSGGFAVVHAAAGVRRKFLYGPLIALPQMAAFRAWVESTAIIHSGRCEIWSSPQNFMCWASQGSPIQDPGAESIHYFKDMNLTGVGGKAAEEGDS